jgi:RNA polymerase sigma-70 factor (ECF subfamily)
VGRPLDDDALDDAALMVRIARGDDAAFRVLYTRYHRTLLDYFYRRLADRSAAEDLLQELCMRLIRTAPRFDPAPPFPPWLWTLAANLLRDAHRRRAARPAEVPLEEAPAALLDEAADPATLLLERLEAAAIERAVADLPVAYREVLADRVWGRRPFGEIAAAQGISVGTARWRMHEALRRLRLALRRAVTPPEGADGPAR